jgi:hypothetical protein
MVIFESRHAARVSVFHLLLALTAACAIPLHLAGMTIAAPVVHPVEGKPSQTVLPTVTEQAITSATPETMESRVPYSAEQLNAMFPLDEQGNPSWAIQSPSRSLRGQGMARRRILQSGTRWNPSLLAAG